MQFGGFRFKIQETIFFGRYSVQTFGKLRAGAIVSADTQAESVNELLSKEWLLTNGRGGFASSTVLGCNTRRYHSLLTGSLNPPVNRIMALSNCLETIVYDDQVFNLSTFEFGENVHPEGFQYLKSFGQDIGVHFDYELNGLRVTKSVYLVRENDTVAVEYAFDGVEKEVSFAIRPLVGLRDFHGLQKSYVRFKSSRHSKSSLAVRYDIPESYELFLNCPVCSFEPDAQWWYNFFYRVDEERGQDFTEDLWSPGYFRCRINAPAKVVLWGSLRSGPTEPISHFDIETVCRDLRSHQEKVTQAAKGDETLRMLLTAADQFVCKRQTDSNFTTTILAGYPWFADWGRDAFIALPGLLLATQRYAEAESVLITFAQAAKEGLIPNCFDDRSDTAYFNSIDSSLWFVNAAFQYLEASGDSQIFARELLPIVCWIVEYYQKGTRFGTQTDKDGLITSGSRRTQLTWMDAKCDGIAFTPRYGKAVEINALWFNNLCQLAKYYAAGDEKLAELYRSRADKVGESFCRLFWNERRKFLNDCVLPDGSPDESLRPNQIFAVSLPFSPLTQERQRMVVEVMEKKLLTPYGLRSLSTDDKRYKGKYMGPQRQRDEAYHQGTIWPFLMGHFIEAYLKVHEFSPESKKSAGEFIAPLLRHLTEDGCLGQVAEIFEGDPPHKPKGCFAQAWSVGELIRVYLMINSGL